MVAHNTSSSSIYLSWMAPKPETIFGEFLGYRITYRTRDVKPENANEIWLRENTVEVRLKVILNQNIMKIMFNFISFIIPI
jgi:hypothetical protein